MAHYITAKLFPRLSSPLCPACSSTKPETVPVKDIPASREALAATPCAPLSPGTRLISGCLCHGLEMTGAGSPSPWQATAQITPLPERANALLMNNKSTLITNCQPNQLALQLSQTASLGTAAQHYGARWPCLGLARLLHNHLIFSSTVLLHLSLQSGTQFLNTDVRVLKHCTTTPK